MKPFYFLPFLPVFPYTRFFIRVFFCRSERRKKRKFRRFFSFEFVHYVRIYVYRHIRACVSYKLLAYVHVYAAFRAPCYKRMPQSCKWWFGHNVLKCRLACCAEYGNTRLPFIPRSSFCFFCPFKIVSTSSVKSMLRALVSVFVPFICINFSVRFMSFHSSAIASFRRVPVYI